MILRFYYEVRNSVFINGQALKWPVVSDVNLFSSCSIDCVLFFNLFVVRSVACSWGYGEIV